MHPVCSVDHSVGAVPMGPRLIGSANRHFLPLAVIMLLASAATAADKDFPNELNSDVEEPKIELSETTEKLPVKAISSRTIKTDDPLIKLVWETREAQRRRLLSTAEHTPWVIMHGMLALREDFVIRHNGEVISGLEWISTGPTYKNEYWFEKTRFGDELTRTACRTRSKVTSTSSLQSSPWAAFLWNTNSRLPTDRSPCGICCATRR